MSTPLEDKMWSPEALEALKAEKSFVESISDPYNIHQLAIEGFLVDPEFIGYLELLVARWSQPSWSRSLKYPLGVEYMRLLTKDAGMRQRAATIGFASEMRTLQENDFHLTE